MSTPSGETNGNGTPESFRVLLIEDDEGDARLVADDLAEWLPRTELTRCHTLREALSRDGTELDCVLLDLGLPDVSGIDALRRLRAGIGSVPVVVLTGLDDEAMGAAAVQAGAQDYLVKGHVEGGELARAIRYAIGRRQTEVAERELLLAEAQGREAERLERGLTPSPVLLDGSIWLASCYRPGRSRALLGGDFMDLLQVAGGHVHALVGDVCGHGPDEAAIGVTLRAAWRALTLSQTSLPEIMRTLQQLLEQERELPSLFATVCALDVELTTGIVELTLAGHPRPALIDGDAVRTLSEGSGDGAIGIGIEAWSSERIALPRGWAILLYTDGIIEGRTDPGPGRLGEAGLRDALQLRVCADPAWRRNPRLVLDELLEEAELANGGPLPDDAAMLLFGASEEPGSA
jgi:serine phosphatase RsbU (regulator of sigma subunit)